MLLARVAGGRVAALDRVAVVGGAGAGVALRIGVVARVGETAGDAARDESDAGGDREEGERAARGEPAHVLDEILRVRVLEAVGDRGDALVGQAQEIAGDGALGLLAAADAGEVVGHLAHGLRCAALLMRGLVAGVALELLPQVRCLVLRLVGDLAGLLLGGRAHLLGRGAGLALEAASLVLRDIGGARAVGRGVAHDSVTAVRCGLVPAESGALGCGMHGLLRHVGARVRGVGVGGDCAARIRGAVVLGHRSDLP